MAENPVKSGQGHTPPIEALSEQELRTEVIDGINTTLGNLPFSPVADGSGSFGYERAKNGLYGLQSAYVRFTKAYEADEQVGVQLELLGVHQATYQRIYAHHATEDKMNQDKVPEEERQQLRE